MKSGDFLPTAFALVKEVRPRTANTDVSSRWCHPYRDSQCRHSRDQCSEADAATHRDTYSHDDSGKVPGLRRT